MSGLEELRELLAKATAGPWAANGFSFFHGWAGHIYAKDAATVTDATMIAACTPDKPAKPFIDDLQPLLWEREQKRKVEANAALIVAMHTALPGLLEAADEIARLREALSCACEWLIELVNGDHGKLHPDVLVNANRDLAKIEAALASGNGDRKEG